MESFYIGDEDTSVVTTTEDGVSQVLIVGAGISGLSAARHLLKNGVSSVTIVEATDKAGGRISTAQFGRSDQNGLVELGAQWIHGEQNELCQLIKACGHRHIKTSWEGKGDFLCPNGTKIESGLVDEVLGWIEDTIEKVEATFSIESFQGEPGKHQQASMGKYLLDRFLAYLKDYHSEDDPDSSLYKLRMALFQWGMSFQRIDNSCDSMQNVSLYRWSEFEVNPGEHYNNFAKGAQSFVDEVLLGRTKDASLESHIFYNSPVDNISWKPEGQGPVKVTTSNGKIFYATSVLVTCSIGVLKSNLESLFTPNIPEKLTSAIKSTGFGPVTKIFLKWSQPWWSPDLKGYQLVWPGEFIDCCSTPEPQDHQKLGASWHKTITGFDPVLDNPNVLVAWLGGPEAVFVETLPDSEISERCADILRKFTGLHVPLPDAVAVSKWNANKFFQGAYSFRAIESDSIAGDICAALCDPVVFEDEHGERKPVILLAGEALSKSHYSTLHGAFESGIFQAAKILQYFQSISSNNRVHTSATASTKNMTTCRVNSSEGNPFKTTTGEQLTFHDALSSATKDAFYVPS